MSWTILGLLILAYVWFSLYRAIRREGKIKLIVWLAVIVLAVGMMIPAGMLTEWGKGSWALIFDRPQIQEQNKPLYNEVFPFKERPAVVVSWNALVSEIDMLANEAYSLNAGYISDWKIDADARSFLKDKIGEEDFCVFAVLYARFENQALDTQGCTFNVDDIPVEELSVWIDKNKAVRDALLDTLSTLSKEVAAELEPRIQEISSQIKDIVDSLNNIKLTEDTTVDELYGIMDLLDRSAMQINDVRAKFEAMTGGNYKDLEFVLGVVDDTKVRVEEMKAYIDKLITMRQQLNSLPEGEQKEKFKEEYKKYVSDVRNLILSLPKEIEVALSGMEDTVLTLRDMPPAIDIIKDAKWYQVKLDNRELFEKMGGIDGYEAFMRATIKEYADKEGIQPGLQGFACSSAMSRIRPYVRCAFTKNLVDRQLKGCPASVFFNREGTAATEGQTTGYKEELIFRVQSDCYGIEETAFAETGDENNVTREDCKVEDQCVCTGAEDEVQEDKTYFDTYIVIDDGRKEKHILIDKFVPTQNICSTIYDRYDISFDKVFTAVFNEMYCDGEKANIASFISPYFGTQSYYIVSENDRKPLEVLSKRGIIEMGAANKPNATGLLVFTFILALVIGGMEMMLRLFLPPVISSTSQYGGASWVWLIVIGVIVFFLEAFFAFTIGGLIVTWINLIGLPPIVM